MKVFRNLGKAVIQVLDDENSRLSALAFLAVLLVMSLGLNLALAWRVRALRTPPGSNTAITGVTLPTVLCSDLEHKPVMINFSDQTKPTVLYILNPRCHWCAKNLNNIKALFSARGNSYRFIGLSLDDPNLNTYVATNPLGFPVYGIASYDAIAKIGFEGTPQTIVVLPNGKIIKNWPGAFINQNKNNVEKYFKYQLPGVSE